MFVQENAMNFCNVFIKKADKKRDRQILFNHRQQLLDQLGACVDHALTLHMAILLIFQHLTGHMLHASGKFVPVLLIQLLPQLSEEQRQLLEEQQQLVVQLLTAGGEEAAVRLEKTTPAVKELVTGMITATGKSG